MTRAASTVVIENKIVENTAWIVVVVALLEIQIVMALKTAEIFVLTAGVAEWMSVAVKQMQIMMVLWTVRTTALVRKGIPPIRGVQIHICS
jgi:hypothetical protein